MKLYVYCLTESLDSLPEHLHGVAGATVRRLDRGSFSLMVSDLSGDSVLVNRDNALAHAAVVQNVLEKTTPLPFRFGTLVTEQQLESYVSARRETLETKLRSIRGCVEMSVKIIRSGDKPAEPPSGEEQDKPGTAFLIEKQQEILGGEVRVAEAKQIAAWLEGRLRDVVREVDIKTNPASKLIMAAAHLVERDRVEEFRSRVADARGERPELHFLLSGPWPPYSFANIDLEFKTQFGVS